MPYQLIYSSASSTPLQPDDLEDILEQAQSNNSEDGITGALVYSEGFFLQILEGERSEVEILMRRISKDLRHERVSILHAGDVQQTAFSDWKMAYVSATPAQVAQWAGLSSTFEPPEVWDSIREDPNKAQLLKKSILAVLVAE